MNTQTFAHTQAFTAINDDELIAVNGGSKLGALAKLGKSVFNFGRNQFALEAAVTMADGAING